MKTLQCLSLESDGSAVVTVRQRTRRFRSLEALAAWLNPEPEADAATANAVTHRSLTMHVESHSTGRELVAV